KRYSAGRRTAWLRPLRNSLAVRGMQNSFGIYRDILHNMAGQEGHRFLFKLLQLPRMPLQLPSPEDIERRAEEDDGDSDQRFLGASDDGIQRPGSRHEHVQRG